MLRVTAHVPAAMAKALPIPADIVVLEHDARRLRRKLLVLQHGDEVMVDFAQTTTLEHGDRLKLDDGSNVEVIAAEEYLYEIRGRNTEHLIRLAWHLGNRHLSAQLEPDRILIKRDHVIRAMLEGLGAAIHEVSEPFTPEFGAYHSHGEPAHALLNK